MTEMNDSKVTRDTLADRGNFLVDPSMLETNQHTPTDPSPITYPPIEEIPYQHSMDKYISGLISEAAPDEISDKLKGIIDLHLRSHSAVLMHSNYEAYMALMLTESAHDPFILEIIEKAKKSQASVSELLTLNLVTDLRSVELKKLSHPFGLRQEYSKDMDTEVADAIKELDGSLFEDPETVVSVLPHQYDTTGFIVTSRDYIGNVGEVIIRKRRTYVVNVDSPEFNPEIRRQIKKVDNSLPHDKWFQQVKDVTGLQGYVNSSVINGKEDPSMLPLSTMIYSYHADRERPKDKMAIKKAQSQQVARHAIKLGSR